MQSSTEAKLKMQFLSIFILDMSKFRIAKVADVQKERRKERQKIKEGKEECGEQKPSRLRPTNLTNGGNRGTLTHGKLEKGNNT